MRRLVQAACLALFCLLLGAAERGGSHGLAADLFLRMDPLIGTAVPLASRAVVATLLPALAVILSAIVAGRIFCGWVCPMGTTLDAAGSLARWQRGKASPVPIARHGKYFLLAAVMTAALLGANIAYWASPIPLVTRLYALVLHPLGLLGLDTAFTASEPFLDRLGADGLLYRLPDMRSYRTAWFVALFWLGLIVLERVRPRFWCRYLCPAGALLGLFSRFALWKRHTGATCTSCGKCAARCPAGILSNNPALADPSECLACRSCQTACPRKAVRFGGPEGAGRDAAPTADARFMPSRRAFCASAAAGIVLAGATHFEAAGRQDGKGTRTSPVRPPGSVPEPAFLARCVRCGECMKACPTGGLQPAWLRAGFSGLFSPFLDPRSGPCAPECASCGAVCPSGAIQALPLEEKRWAKIGTAEVDRALCIAWAEDKRCMVCQETCPYGAVSVVPREGHIAPVPVVRAERCYGCGYCEKHCPTAAPSIRVLPDGALRRHGPGFEHAAVAAGLDLDPSRREPDHSEFDPTSGGAPPGFLE